MVSAASTMEAAISGRASNPVTCKNGHNMCLNLSIKWEVSICPEFSWLSTYEHCSFAWLHLTASIRDTLGTGPNWPLKWGGHYCESKLYSIWPFGTMQNVPYGGSVPYIEVPFRWEFTVYYTKMRVNYDKTKLFKRIKVKNDGILCSLHAF